MDKISSPRVATAFIAAALLSATGGCSESAAPAEAAGASPTAAAAASAEPVRATNTPPLDPKNAVSIAIGSPDHTTLVAALKAADYVTAVSNPGPLTVFAPTNAAFEKLPAGTVETLVKPENLEKLQHILKFHVTTSVWDTKYFKDGQSLSMANGAKTTLHVKDGKYSINDANIVASIPASNGIIHVIDGVLLPPSE
jgi:uncharacterized surface protein with fasciclin (FAS1) repeats